MAGDLNQACQRSSVDRAGGRFGVILPAQGGNTTRLIHTNREGRTLKSRASTLSCGAHQAAKHEGGLHFGPRIFTLFQVPDDNFPLNDGFLPCRRKVENGAGTYYTSRGPLYHWEGVGKYA